MGNKSSTTEVDNSTANSSERSKLLGDQIFSAITSELQETLQKSTTATGSASIVYIKKTSDIIALQDTFTEYRKLVEDAKDQKLQRMGSEYITLKSSLEDYKQKLEEITKGKQELEQDVKKKTVDQEKTVRELNEKCKNTATTLSTECDKTKTLEKEIEQMKMFKTKFEAQVRKTEELQRELGNVRDKLLDEIKAKLELETKLKLNNCGTKDESAKVMRSTIDQQAAMIKQVQEALMETQEKFNNELRNKGYDPYTLRREKLLTFNLKKEKKDLLTKLQTLEAEAAKQWVERKLKCDEQEKQLKDIKQVEETLKATQQKLDDELVNKRYDAIKYAREKELSLNLTKEKENLMIKLRTVEAEAEKERAQSKLKCDEQERQLKEISDKLSAVEKTNRQQVKLKKKAQAELSLLRETNSPIKQLEAKLEEKDRILMEYLKEKEEKPQEQENQLQLDDELSSFLKMSEEARSKEIQTKSLELSDLKSKYEFQLKQQQERFNRIVYRLKMTEEKRDQLEQARKEAAGKLNLLENSFNDIKQFSEKELKQRKDFLEDFYKVKRQSEEDSEQLVKASTSKGRDSFLSVRMDLEAQLDSKTNEIALLKQQLKLKETEIKSMASEADADKRRNEMAKLHDEFMENMKKFNQN